MNFDLYPGEIHALIGENGAGKSTLIKILSGAQSADMGQVLLRGQEVVFHNPREAIDQGIATINQELMLSLRLKLKYSGLSLLMVCLTNGIGLSQTLT